MADDPSTLASALLKEVGWVRGLAAQLVGTHAADDVAQDAWIAAAKSKPTADEPLRPWLAAVVRKLAHTRKRSEARRRGYESSAAAQAVDTANPEALLARAELLRLIGELVTGLEEPYRSTILLRYYEGLSSQQIAERLGVADGTVRWRLKQGLDELRRVLDRRVEGGRGAWTLVLGTASVPTKAVVATKVASTAALVLKIAGVVSVVALGSVLAVRAAHHRGRPAATERVSPSGAHGTVSSQTGAEQLASPAPQGEARASLDDAQRAYMEGRYDEAIQLAEQAKSKEPSKAWRVIGASSCFKADGDGAGAAWNHLDPTGRKFVEYVCARNHVAIPKDVDGRKVL